MAMTWNDYKNQVLNDAKEAIKEQYDSVKDWNEMYELLQLDDAVTGNGSGSYTFSRAKAEENVAGIIWDSDVIYEFDTLGYRGIPTEKGAEEVDVIARYIALDHVGDDLEDYYNALKNGEDVEED